VNSKFLNKTSNTAIIATVKLAKKLNIIDIPISYKILLKKVFLPKHVAGLSNPPKIAFNPLPLTKWTVKSRRQQSV
jgi:hypothetical protein